MGLLFLLLTLFLLVLLKITSESVNGFGYSYGFSLEGFSQAEKSDGELLIVKANWCGHCQQAMPEFKKLEAMKTIPIQSGQVLKVRLLDSDADKEEIKGLNVRGFPTIMVKAGNSTQEYQGERTAAAIQEYLSSLNL